MRIGLFGGTFDPIHLAHLRAAEEIREACHLDEIRFVPSAVPPHKRTAGLTDAAHRLAMVELAVAGVPGFRVWPIELERPGPSYSIDTIRALTSEVGPAGHVVFILGRDAFADFHTWRDYTAIFGLCDIAVMTRPPASGPLTDGEIPVAARGSFQYVPGSDAFVHGSGHRVTLHHITPLDISATAIRARVARGASVRFLVPSAVETYITQHGLYRPGASA